MRKFLGGDCPFVSCTYLVLPSWVEPDLGHWELRPLYLLAEGGRAGGALRRTKRRKKLEAYTTPAAPISLLLGQV